MSSYNNGTSVIFTDPPNHLQERHNNWAQKQINQNAGIAKVII